MEVPLRSIYQLVVLSLERNSYEPERAVYIKKISPWLTQTHLIGYLWVLLCQAKLGEALPTRMTHCKSDYTELCEKHCWDVLLDKLTQLWFTGGWEQFVCLLVSWCECVAVTCVTALLSRLVSSAICLSAASAFSLSLSSCSVWLS